MESKNVGLESDWVDDDVAGTAEGPVAKAIESKTAKLPSDLFLWASLASMAVSFGLQLSGNKKLKHASSFIGQWAPTLLVLGLYNKVVKVAGHDRASGGNDDAGQQRKKSS